MASTVSQRGGAGQPHQAQEGAAEGEQGGAADQATEGSAEGHDECLLTSLPDAVVAGLWPAERVLEGFAICSKGLSRALRCAPKVDLRGWKLEDDVAEAVAGLLEPMVGLKWLDIGGHAIGARGVTALAGALRAMTGLEHLSIITYYGQSKPEAMMVIAPCLPPSLLHLDLSGSWMGKEGATALARALETMTGLQHLVLHSNFLRGVGDEGLRALVGALPGGLLHLNLEGNALGAQGARVLGPCLPPGLLHLSLAENDLGVEGVIAITPFFPPSLQYLDMGFNDMRAEGARVFVRHLPRSLLHLCVCDNNLEEEGAWAIAHNLPSLLEDLDLSYNFYRPSNREMDEDYDAFKRALRLFLKLRVRSFDMQSLPVEF